MVSGAPHQPYADSHVTVERRVVRYYKIVGDSEDGQLDRRGGKRRDGQGANVDLPRRKVGKTPTEKEIATSIIVHSSMHDELFGASHLNTRLSALNSAAQAHDISCMTCVELKHSLHAQRNRSLAPGLQDS